MKNNDGLFRRFEENSGVSDRPVLAGPGVKGLMKTMALKANINNKVLTNHSARNV